MTPGRVVAELGRPETPAETAARKAESSRLHRERQTFSNLVYALIATLAVVLLIVLFAPKGQVGPQPSVDYHQVASEGAGVEPAPLLDPKLGEGWRANAAQLDTDASGGVDVWHIGLISPKGAYVGVDQGFRADDAWVALTLDGLRATGQRTIGGVSWVVYDNRQHTDAPITYALVAEQGASTVVLSGTAAVSEFDTVAAAAAAALEGGS